MKRRRSRDPLAVLRSVCLALPEAHEVQAWGFFKPPYVGPSGWVGIHLDKRPNWRVVAEIIADGYALIAPRRLRK